MVSRELQGTAARRPQSATNFALSVIAMAVGLGLVWLIAPWHQPDMGRAFQYLPLIPCLGVILVIAGAELMLPRLRAARAGGVTQRTLRPLDLRRVGVRLAGFAATLGSIAFVYWLLPEYHGDFYGPYWLFLRTLAPVAVLVPLYFLWADPRSGELRDEYYVFGSLFLGRTTASDWPLIGRHLLGWTVKAFFLPLMTVYLDSELRSLYGAWVAAQPATLPAYQLFYHLSYAIDLLYCVVGYTATTRLFDSHIRSVEPSVAGWLVALICYQPFYSVIGGFYLQYDQGTFWDNWLQAWPTLRALWAAAIIVLALTYALCTVSFGLRFSNLTHRGIITSGPYRFTKHPAYLAKNLSWWLISVPFAGGMGWSTILRDCCLLALLNGIYYLRARTEERHLSRDPTYVAYALWMNEHGLLRRLIPLLPFLRYRAPAGAGTGAEKSGPVPQRPSN